MLQADFVNTYGITYKIPYIYVGSIVDYIHENNNCIIQLKVRTVYYDAVSQ
jgi:hypothetical protein